MSILLVLFLGGLLLVGLYPWYERMGNYLLTKCESIEKKKIPRKKGGTKRKDASQIT
ncbi:hypothetical protein EDC32_1074 [Laceyella sacchari]|nr:hypothetical protein EDC32_1074 [Laceyella sacchari]